VDDDRPAADETGADASAGRHFARSPQRRHLRRAGLRIPGRPARLSDGDPTGGPDRRAEVRGAAKGALAVIVVVVGGVVAAVQVGGWTGDGGGPAGPEPSASPVPSAGCGATTADRGLDRLTVESGGIERPYIRQVPAAHDGVAPVPLVVDLPGFNEDGAAHAGYTQLSRYGDETGFAVVTPEGRDAPQAWDTLPGSSDVRFIEDLLDEAERTMCVDTARVYVTGLSNGAMLASTLACVLADRVAAVAAVAGVSPVAQGTSGSPVDECVPDRPVPIMAVHGTDDTIVRYGGGLAPGVADLPVPGGVTLGDQLPRSDLSVPDVMAVWAERDGCGTDAEERHVRGDVSMLRFPCPDGVDVELYVVHGGGHTWPGASMHPPNEILASAVRDFGKTSPVSANQLMWRFFATHPLTESP